MFKEDELIDSHISFVPFIRFMKEKAAHAEGARAAYFQEIVRHFESNPALQQPLREDIDIANYQEYLDLLTATVFPITMDESRDIFGIGVPYRFAIFYYSERFRQIFSEDGGELKAVPKGISEEKVKNDKLTWMYKLILERMYNLPVHYDAEIIHNIINPETGLHKYIKLNIDPRFVDVKVKGELPPLNCDNICVGDFKLQSLADLRKLLPLENFALEGFVIWTIQDVTKEHVVAGMKNLVLNIRKDNELKTYAHAREYLKTLAGRADMSVHLTPFLKVNNRNVMENVYVSQSIIFSSARNEAERIAINEQLLEYLSTHRQPLVIQDVNRQTVALYPFLKYLPLQGVKSFILLPVVHGNNLLGILELATNGGEPLDWDILGRLQPSYAVGTMLLGRSMELANERINEVIKEQFTALQPAVEWKFTEAAWEYLHAPKENKKAIAHIQFEDVYPLYGAVDIRNSSVERGSAIRDDLREQLLLIQETFSHINGDLHLPLLEELQYKNNRMLNNMRETLFAEDEVRINEFLDYEIAPTFRHLYESEERLKPALNDYFEKIDKTSGHIYHHRREYEESLQDINSAINRYLDKEKDELQRSFPCYFEKYRTDGVEYNIYIGQSIAPDKKFDMIYLRNVRLWQLSSMAQIARITHALEPKLRIPLQTTQLVLAHSNPIAISFRKDERRFDVEGAYNIRYEIMKKRIDKVRVRGTNERLTQPGKIAIVYAYVREADEYKKYIEFLQNKNMLMPELEMLDLEDVQGISGLRAMRVTVNMEGLVKTEA
ncbi:hypothetical protein EGT74_11815 [Chitinophaga lutea]|uniref:GAF domain-containing protein n=2 Tax=Chitinophaga lutea TaxID=2488634 RepID=A0A3N4QDX2_9BACT|nr:hypothetical protein EGT74_11815 [Chitinophaga lutea]